MLGFFTNILEQENLGLSRDHLEKVWGYFELTHELIKKNGVGKTPKEFTNMIFLLKDMEKIAQIEISDLIENCSNERILNH